MKFLRTLLTYLIALSIVISPVISETAFAADTSALEAGSIESSSIILKSTKTYNIGAGWGTIAKRSSGINGNVVWEKDNVTGVAANGTLNCGKNVTVVKLQIKPRSVLTGEKNFDVSVTF